MYGADADVMKTSDWWRSLAYAVLGRTPTRSEDRRKLDALNACALPCCAHAQITGINSFIGSGALTAEACAFCKTKSFSLISLGMLPVFLHEAR